jgi:hypothetical protein
MAEARQLKQREYFTNVIAHDVTPTKHTSKDHRHTNTFKSTVLD